MPDTPWKKEERAVALILSRVWAEADRNPLSGMDGRTGTKADNKGTGDVFVEVKNRRAPPGWSTFRDARKKAEEEGKRITVVTFHRSGQGKGGRFALIDLEAWMEAAEQEMLWRERVRAKFEAHHDLAGCPTCAAIGPPQFEDYANPFPDTHTSHHTGGRSEAFCTYHGVPHEPPICPVHNYYKELLGYDSEEGHGAGHIWVCPKCDRGEAP